MCQILLHYNINSIPYEFIPSFQTRKVRSGEPKEFARVLMPG